MQNDRVIEFLRKHKNTYPEYFEENRLEKTKYGYTCDINQIYCYLNEVDITKTDYFRFFKIIQKYFNLKNKNLVEVGCGYIPVLSNIIKKNTNCKITAINNKILIKNYNDINTIETDLTQDFDFNNYDLIVGFRPCIITEKIILECFKYKKEFIIYLCPCANEPLNKTNYNHKTWHYQDWHRYLIQLVKNNKKYITTIIYNQLDDDCPIIIGNINQNKI